MTRALLLGAVRHCGGQVSEHARIEQRHITAALETREAMRSASIVFDRDPIAQLAANMEQAGMERAAAWIEQLAKEARAENIHLYGGEYCDVRTLDHAVDAIRAAAGAK